MVEPSPLSVLTQEEILARFLSVFSDDMSQLSGEYRIHIDPNAQPVQHPSRHVAVVLRPKLRETFENLVEQDVITQSSNYTDAVDKLCGSGTQKEWQVQPCLALNNPNNAIQRENYPLLMIEEIVT